MSIKLAPRKIYIPHDEDEEKEQPKVVLTPRKVNGKLAIGYIPDDYEHYATETHSEGDPSSP